MAKKEITKEEKEREESRALNVKNTLESKVMQEAFAGNMLKSNPYLYGQMGSNGGEVTYTSAMNSEEAQKQKQELYNQKSALGKQLGVAGEPTITNYDLSLKWMQQMEEVLQIAKIDELQKYASGVGAKLDFKVPEKLKNYKLSDLAKDGKIDPKKLSDVEKDAFTLHQNLSEAYKTAVMNNAVFNSSYSEINQIGKELEEKYNPKEKETKK